MFSVRVVIRLKKQKITGYKSRRAILRSPLDRIGYGGYLKLAVEWRDLLIQLPK